MALEGERPKPDESAVRFRVKKPEVGAFKAPRISQAARGEQEPQAESTESVAGEPPPVPGQELTVFDRMAQLEQQLKEAQGELERLRALNTAKVRRYRERHREQVREYDRAYKRERRAAQRREQDSESG
jgi:TolA-binding protein